MGDMAQVRIFYLKLCMFLVCCAARSDRVRIKERRRVVKVQSGNLLSHYMVQDLDNKVHW